eukprot:g4296.t1
MLRRLQQRIFSVTAKHELKLSVLQSRNISSGTGRVLAASAADSSSSSGSGGGDGGASSSTTAPSGQSDRIHSTDIAFKPNNDGWGYTPKYKSSYERIFGNKQGSDASPEPEERVPEPSSAVAESPETSDGFLRKAFTMRLKFDNDNFDEVRQTYTRMHTDHELLQPLLKVLKAHGVRNYSIFLNQDREDPTLFGYVEVKDEDQWQSISSTDECKAWWKEMSAIMETNSDNSPKSVELHSAFFME